MERVLPYLVLLALVLGLTSAIQDGMLQDTAFVEHRYSDNREHGLFFCEDEDEIMARQYYAEHQRVHSATFFSIVVDSDKYVRAFVPIQYFDYPMIPWLDHPGMPNAMECARAAQRHLHPTWYFDGYECKSNILYVDFDNRDICEDDINNKVVYTYYQTHIYTYLSYPTTYDYSCRVGPYFYMDGYETLYYTCNGIDYEMYCYNNELTIDNNDSSSDIAFPHGDGCIHFDESFYDYYDEGNWDDEPIYPLSRAELEVIETKLAILGADCYWVPSDRYENGVHHFGEVELYGYDFFTTFTVPDYDYVYMVTNSEFTFTYRTEYDYDYRTCYFPSYTDSVYIDNRIYT